MEFNAAMTIRDFHDFNIQNYQYFTGNTFIFAFGEKVEIPITISETAPKSYNVMTTSHNFQNFYGFQENQQKLPCENYWNPLEIVGIR